VVVNTNVRMKPEDWARSRAAGTRATAAINAAARAKRAAEAHTLFADGHTRTEIAKIMGLSASTVRSYLTGLPTPGAGHVDDVAIERAAKGPGPYAGTLSAAERMAAAQLARSWGHSYSVIAHRVGCTKRHAKRLCEDTPSGTAGARFLGGGQPQSTAVLPVSLSGQTGHDTPRG
jgi:DNA-binding CsgD family transcriptional regulator